MQLEKRKSVYGQEVFGIILDQQQYPQQKLKNQKIDNLEQLLGEIYIKPQNINQLQANQDDDYADYLLYIFFLEKQDQIQNRVNEQILGVRQEKDIKFQKLIAQDPLEFEDDFGQKIKKAYALQLTNNHFYTKKMKLEELNIVEIVLWFKSFKEEECVLFLQKKSICFGFSGQNLFFNYKNKNLLKSKEMKISSKFWQNLRIKIISNQKIEIYLQNQFQSPINETINIKIKAETIFLKPCYFFSQFDGLIAEVKILKREITEEELENYNMPMNPIFKQSSKIKLNIKKSIKLPERIEEIQEDDFALNLKRSKSKTLKRKTSKNIIKNKDLKISKFSNGPTENFSFRKNLD